MLSLPVVADEAHASELAVTYFTVVARGDPDFGTTGCCVFANDLVRSWLGPNGLPVINPLYRQPERSRYLVHDVNEHGEITWWTPRSTVTPSGSGIAQLPINNRRLFPPNGMGTSDADGFQTAVFRGILHVPLGERVNFRLGADDVALLYVDGALIVGLGGVHPRLNAPVATETLRAGDHCLTLFYADLYRFHAELFLAIETADVTVSASADAESEVKASPLGCSVPVS